MVSSRDLVMASAARSQRAGVQARACRGRCGAVCLRHLADWRYWPWPAELQPVCCSFPWCWDGQCCSRVVPSGSAGSVTYGQRALLRTGLLCCWSCGGRPAMQRAMVDAARRGRGICCSGLSLAVQESCIIPSLGCLAHPSRAVQHRSRTGTTVGTAASPSYHSLPAARIGRPSYHVSPVASPPAQQCTSPVHVLVALCPSPASARRDWIRKAAAARTSGGAALLLSATRLRAARALLAMTLARPGPKTAQRSEPMDQRFPVEQTATGWPRSARLAWTGRPLLDVPCLQACSSNSTSQPDRCSQ